MVNRDYIKKELKRIFRSMDFIGKRFLSNEKACGKDFQVYFDIYQQLGFAWEFIGLQCEHWDGYRNIRDNKEACKICGKVKGVEDSYYLFPKDGQKKIGKRLIPNSKKTFKNKKEAAVLYDSINFHGAALLVDVHNSYKSSLFKDKINIAAERSVKLKESGIVCSVDQHLICIEIDKKVKNMKYGGFPWEIKKEHLKKFPVIFDFDEDYNFLGLTILR